MSDDGPAPDSASPAPPAGEPPPRTGRGRRVLGRVLAWAVTLGVLGWLFWTTPVADVWAALGQARPWMVPATVGAVLLIYLGDTFAIWKTFGWFLAPLRFREVLIVRGASYFLALVSYAVGQGAIVYFMHRSHRVPVMRGVAAVLLIMGTNVLVLLAMMTLGLIVGREHPPALVPVAIGLWAGLILYAVVVAIKPRFLAQKPLFDVLLSAGLGGHLKAMAVRLPHVAALMLFNLVFLHGFGVAVPLPLALVSLPAVMFMAALPISIQGLGTTQALLAAFFSSYAPAGTDARATVIASSLAAQGIALGCQAIIGVVCMRSSVARDLGERRS